MEDDQQVPVDKLLEELKAVGNTASIRFAVVAGEDARMQLQLQCLPGSANTLMGKPLLRGLVKRKIIYFSLLLNQFLVPKLLH